MVSLTADRPAHRTELARRTAQGHDLAIRSLERSPQVGNSPVECDKASENVDKVAILVYN